MQLGFGGWGLSGKGGIKCPQKGPLQTGKDMGNGHSLADVHTGTMLFWWVRGATAGETGSLDTEVQHGSYCHSYNLLNLSAGWSSEQPYSWLLVPICNEEIEAWRGQAPCPILQGITAEWRPSRTS